MALHDDDVIKHRARPGPSWQPPGLSRGDELPLYQRIRSNIVALVLAGGVGDGSPLPSVRTLARKWAANPLTVAKAYRGLQESGIVEARRGVGFFVISGGRARLRESERARFFAEDWPNIAQEMRRLDITHRDLCPEASTASLASGS